MKTISVFSSLMWLAKGYLATMYLFRGKENRSEDSTGLNYYLSLRKMQIERS